MRDEIETRLERYIDTKIETINAKLDAMDFKLKVVIWFFGGLLLLGIIPNTWNTMKGAFSHTAQAEEAINDNDSPLTAD